MNGGDINGCDGGSAAKCKGVFGVATPVNFANQISSKGEWLLGSCGC